MKVSWTVANVGQATAADHSYDNFYLSTDPLFDSSDVQIGSLSSPSTINPGESYSPSTTLPLHQASPGPQFVLLVVNGSESLGETDETDNVLAVPIDIALPNLIVSNITAPPTVASGNAVDIGWTVENTSGHPAGTDWYDYVYLSRDELFGSDDQSLGSQYVGSLTPLAPGDSYSTSGSVSFNRIASGDYFLLVVSEPRRPSIAEIDDDDDALAVSSDDHGARRGSHGLQRAGFGDSGRDD